MAPLPLYQVDAFSAQPFAGNPAAVVLLSGDALPMSDAVRQAIAAEMNLAETAFVEPLSSDGDGDGDGDDGDGDGGDGDGDDGDGGDGGSEAASAADVLKTGVRFKLRWFTPTREVPLCGHATLASAAVLRYEVGNRSPELRFETLSGTLIVRVSEGGDLLEMSLPASPPAEPLPEALAPRSEAFEALLRACTGDVAVTHVGFTGAPLNYLLLAVEEPQGGATPQYLATMQPDLGAMRASASEEDVTGVIVTVRAAPASGYDVLSRFFAPWAGINEDPVTGSAHAVLAPFYAPLLGRMELRARQCSQRGGDVLMRMGQGDEKGRVVVSGPARVVLRGQLLL